MIWIIGEYAERIDNADELLETFLETFPEETSMVREGAAVLCCRACRQPCCALPELILTHIMTGGLVWRELVEQGGEGREC
jgi:hypothetical protein